MEQTVDLIRAVTGKGMCVGTNAQIIINYVAQINPLVITFNVGLEKKILFIHYEYNNNLTFASSLRKINRYVDH